MPVGTEPANGWEVLGTWLVRDATLAALVSGSTYDLGVTGSAVVLADAGVAVLTIPLLQAGLSPRDDLLADLTDDGERIAVLDWTGGLHARASARRLDEARAALTQPSNGPTTPPQTGSSDSTQAWGAPVGTWPPPVQSGGGRVVRGHRAGQAGTKVCPQCAENVKAAALVCRFCGYRFAVAAASPGVASTATAVGAVQGDLLCPDCGRPNPNPDRFCGGCGFDFDPPDAADWAETEYSPGGRLLQLSGPEWLVVVGGILVAVGTVLPWATVTNSLISRSIGGFDVTGSDAALVLILGAVIAIPRPWLPHWFRGGWSLSDVALGLIAIGLAYLEASSLRPTGFRHGDQRRSRSLGCRAGRRARDGGWRGEVAG